MHFHFRLLVFVLCLFGVCNAFAQKSVGDTLSFSVIAGGSISVPANEAWDFVSLSYNHGGYSMLTTYDGPDTLAGGHVWVAPIWNVEAQLLGDGRTDGMYLLKVIKIK